MAAAPLADPQCAHAVDRCREEPLGLRKCKSGHLVSCHRAEELTLKGIASWR